uniref:Uncharacterized protein n=1 Tax=Ditylenchus dipsaci TaxID=166011 RepID=A0A915ECQ0_9BILA
MPQLNPESINVDFEQVALNSLRFAFPDADLNECFFHLMKNFEKHLGEAGLITQYSDPAFDFALTSRRILSLAFVPPLDVYECLHELQVYLMSHQPCLEPVLKWFSSNYVVSVYRYSDEASALPVSLWSCYERTLRGEDRTNNFAEAAHRRLQTIPDIHHPTMGLFVGEMKKVSDHTYEQCIRGQQAPEERRVYQEADKRILALVELYGTKSLIEYLRGLAHNFIMDQ